MTAHQSGRRAFFLAQHAPWQPRVSNGDRNEVTAFAGIGYYAHGGPAGRSLANGATSEWGYDAVQRLTAVVQNAAGTSADLFLSLTYNPASQIASRTLSNDSYAWTGHYAVNRNYTTNGRNQYTAAGGASFSYDGNGNLTSDGTNTFTYDAENRLLSSSNGAALTYDPLGRLYQVTLGGSTTRFLHDGNSIVAEYNGSGTMTRRYVHWVGADVPLLSYAGTDLSQPSYLHSDQQGSIVMVSSQSGSPTINSYDEYGIPQSSNIGRFGFTGQAWLAEIGMYYYRARIYSPTLGRFLQTDPIGYAGGMNLQAYVGNDPVNRNDPSGMCSHTYGMFKSTDWGPVKNSETVMLYSWVDLSGCAGLDIPAIPGLTLASMTDTGSSDGTFKPSTCTMSFGGAALSESGSRHYDLGRVEFRMGLDNEASEITRAAYNTPGTAAVTQWDVVYVSPASWSEVTNPNHASFWEEVRHSVQFQNTSFFHAQYGASSAAAWLRGDDPYTGNGFEREAKDWARTTAAAYQRARACR